jgi:MarR family transcriptional regulator, 2-MHQ and catechol-resistance regulon repressor
MSRVKYDPELIYSTWWMMTITRRAMSKARAKELLPYGITTEQAAVLNIVNAIGEKATPAEISRAMIREANSTTSIINTMVKKGLLNTTKDLERRNLIRVSLTDRGYQILKKINKRKPMTQIMSTLSLEEIHQLREILGKLQQKALKEAGIKFTPVFNQDE